MVNRTVLAIILLSFSLSGFSTCRNSAIKHKFDVMNGYPHGREGFIVDHVCSLFNGGLDAPVNMQYQTPLESLRKDRIENTSLGKKLFCTPKNSTPTRQVFNCKRTKR